jgi:hypothetical protein
MMGRRCARLLVANGLFLVVAGLAVANPKPTMTAPTTGAVGRIVHVSAHNLKRGQYSLTLYANKAPTKNDFCQIRLATAPRPETSVTFSARVPKRIPCYSGFPGSSRGSIETTTGKYDLIVAVRQGTSFSGSYSYVRRTIRIAGQ